MNTIVAELEGQTDLPVRVVGIHDWGGGSFNANMYLSRPATWLREDEANRPWTTWRIPIASRPGQEVRWKDVVILNTKNEFVAVQNLDQESLSSGANRAKLKNVIQSAATISDTDIDGIPDTWEFDHFGNISPNAQTPVEGSGLPALLAYAFSQTPGDYDSARNPTFGFVDEDGEIFPQVTYRRRLGGESERLEYRVEISDDGSSWRPAGAELVEVDATNPWDGTGTEIVTLRSSSPIVSTNFRFARVAVDVPL